MEHALLEKVAIVSSIGAFVGIGFLYVRRISVGSSARHWAWAWLAFFVSLASSVASHPAANLAAHATGTVFPVLLLAGAFSFVGRSMPRFWIPLGLTIGLVRGTASTLGIPLLPDLGVYLFEAPVAVAAGWVVLRQGAGFRGMPIVAVLGVLLASFGILEVTNTIFLQGDGSGSFIYFSVGMLATLALALTQILVLAEQVREVHVADLELLRQIAQAGSLGHDARAVVAHALDALRERMKIDAGGAWLLRDEDRHLECMGFFAHVDMQMPEDLRVSSPNRPLPKFVLQTGEPIWIDDLLAQPDLPVHGLYADIGMRTGAVLPLRRGADSLGILILGRTRVQPFEESERRILQAAASELSLALQRVEAVVRLADERRVLASVLAASPTGILVAGPDGVAQLMNETFGVHMGLGEGDTWAGRQVSSMAMSVSTRFGEPADFASAFERAIDGPPITVSATIGHPEERDLLIFSAPIPSEPEDGVAGRVWVTRDVSEELRLQAQLRQSQKMETLGTLAGGVAHDFNNQLTAILGNTRWVQDRESNDAEVREALGDAIQAAEHCADLTRSLLAFARRAPLAVDVVSTHALCDQVASLLRSLLPATIDFQLIEAADLPAIAADSTQLQQALINLIVNARDASEGDGSIVLSVQSREVLQPPHEDADPGLYVEFRVQDDGAGMDEQTRQRIFDPFFTTKGMYEGTGLGLAVVYGAARSHGGWVEVESAPGEGSTFSVLIPASSDVVELERRDVPTTSAPGRETILVVDDEPSLRRLVQRVLGRAGYRTLEAADGREAVECFERAADEVDLVVIDVTMPHLDGVEALARMRRIRPEVPAILVSGLLELDTGALDERRTEYLPKPYDLAHLEAAVRRALDPEKDSTEAEG